MAGLDDFYHRQGPRVLQQQRKLLLTSAEATGSLPSFPHSHDEPDHVVVVPPATPINTDSSDRYAGLGLGLVGLVTDNLVAHPFLVLRRQCQVNNAAVRCHRTPFTLLPVLVALNRSQGAATLWKGLGSSLTVRGLTLAVEDFTSKFTPWPKEIDSRSSPRMIGQHLLLKGVSLAVLTPFFSASLVETVQSEIASERPGIFDVFREGFSRLISWSGPHCGRMLPIWVLVPATVTYGVVHYIIYTVAKGLSHTIMVKAHRSRQKTQGAVSKEGASSLPGLAQYHEQMSSLIGHLAGDALLFPLETILHRIHLQGCRTIIDNLDTGREVMPIMTRYEGLFDCFSTVMQEEGTSGLFKGFGALILQYAAHFAIIRFSAVVIREVAKLVHQDTPSPDMLAKAAVLPAAAAAKSVGRPPSSSGSSLTASPTAKGAGAAAAFAGDDERDRSLGDFITLSGHVGNGTRRRILQSDSDT